MSDIAKCPKCFQYFDNSFAVTHCPKCRAEINGVEISNEVFDTSPAPLRSYSVYILPVSVAAIVLFALVGIFTIVGLKSPIFFAFAGLVTIMVYKQLRGFK